MKTIDGSSKIRFVFLMMLSFIMMFSCYVYHNYATYKSIQIVANKTATIEYGSANYDIEELIKKIEGKIVSVKKNVDTSIVGEQEMVFEVQKDNIVRDVPVLVSVVDSIAPVIKIDKEKITITKGEAVDLKSNVLSVVDGVDKDIQYSDKELEKGNAYYTLSYFDDLNAVGVHTIIVEAHDRAGNGSSQEFLLEVLAPPVQRKAPVVYHNLPANASAGNLVSIAYSLIGSPYVSGANGPYAFDCSGFVQYVYAQVGIHVSRSSSTQLYDGSPVSYEEAQPGDILSWGYTDGVATHSALYVGNGQMVHATNPRQGVIASDVAAWTRGSGTRVISVRRIQ